MIIFKVLFLVAIGLSLVVYAYILYVGFMKNHNKVQTGTIFDANDMPTVFDEAVEQLKDGAL